MEKSSIIAIVIVAVVVVVAGVGLYYSAQTPQPAPQQANNQQTAPAQPENTTGLTTPANDLSDSAISQDLSTVDSQMQDLAADSQSASQSITQ